MCGDKGGAFTYQGAQPGQFVIGKCRVESEHDAAGVLVGELKTMIEELSFKGGCPYQVDLGRPPSRCEQ